MLFNPAVQFEFDILDPGKLCAILSTHLSLISDSAGNQSTVASQLYSSLLHQIKRLYPPSSSAFDLTQVDFKLCELFTAQVLFTTNTFCSDEYQQFYAPILDMFSNAKVKLDLDYYFRLCHDKKWGIFSAYLITQKAIPDFIALALGQLSDPSIPTLLTLKRCLFLYGKTSKDTTKLTNVCQSIDSQITSKSTDFSYESQLFVKSQESLNELLYHIDVIISQLFVSSSEIDQQISETFKANKQVYSDLTREAATLLVQCNDYIDVCDLQGCYLFWTVLLGHLDHVFGCGQPESLDSILNSSTVDKYDFLRKLIHLYECKQSSIFSPSAVSNEKYYAFFIQLLYSLLINNLEYYFDCPLFDSISPIQEEYEKTNFDRVDFLLKSDKFWSTLLVNSTNESNLQNLFNIVAKLDNAQLNLDLTNRHQQLLTFTLTILSRNRLTNVSYFEKLFQKRVALFGIERISFNRDLFGRNLIKEAAFAKVKVDFQQHKIQKLALDIIHCAFISPLDTFDSLLNSVLIFSPLNYNHFIVHLLCHHFRPLSQFNSFVNDILTDSKLNLIASMTVLKSQQNFDILSVDSFNDYLQLLTKSSGIHFETLLANLLAYSNVQQQNLSLHWLQSIFDLVKHNQFESSNAHSFTIVSAFLLNLLFSVWNDQTKKEIIISTIRIYTRKNVTKLTASEAKRIGHLVQASIGDDFSVEYLLFYLEESLSFPTKQLLRLNSIRSILYYAAISSKSDWILPTLTAHTNYIFDQLYHVLGDIVLCLTQKELVNLTTLLAKLYSKMHLFLVVSLLLATKLDSIEAFSVDSLVYFSRSLFMLIGQIPAQLKNNQTETDNKAQLYDELLYIFFVWNCIETKLESQKGAAGLGNEICLEVKKVVQSIEKQVKECAIKWKIEASNETNYIDDVYRRFKEELKRTGDNSGSHFTGFDDNLKSNWKTHRKVKTTITECK